MTVNNFPIKNLASKPIFGLEVSKSAARKVQIAEGTCRDSPNRS